jgi:hypothetical protein
MIGMGEWSASWNSWASGMSVWELGREGTRQVDADNPPEEFVYWR